MQKCNSSIGIRIGLGQLAWAGIAGSTSAHVQMCTYMLGFGNIDAPATRPDMRFII